MANKFLGASSLTAIKKYIDRRIANLNNNRPSNVINNYVTTIQAYQYSETPLTEIPEGGSIAQNGIITYPTGWSALCDVQMPDSTGSVYMTSSEFRNGAAVEWSYPIRITPIDALEVAPDGNIYLSINNNRYLLGTKILDDETNVLTLTQTI